MDCGGADHDCPVRCDSDVTFRTIIRRQWRSFGNMQAYLKNIVIDKSVRGLCRRPYPNHPKGCPNYGKRSTCPPQVKLIDEIFDANKGFWIVWVDFDFASHCNNMKTKHPNWTQRQIECCLYWQGTAKKKLKEELQDVMYYLEGSENWELVNNLVPEAMGVNVTATMKNIGVELEWPPKKIVRKVALLGVERIK